MSFAHEPRAEETPPGEREDACILDAVVCVHFAGANLNRVLVAALESVGWVILVPAEVCDEIARKDAKYPGLRERWLSLERSDRVRVLPALEVGTAPARVIAVLEEIRDLEFDQALRRSRDLGECVVVAHGVHLAEQGREVTLLMDDAGGRQLADQWSLAHLTIEDVLVLAITRDASRRRTPSSRPTGSFSSSARVCRTFPAHHWRRTTGRGHRAGEMPEPGSVVNGRRQAEPRRRHGSRDVQGQHLRASAPQESSRRTRQAKPLEHMYTSSICSSPCRTSSTVAA